MAQLVVAENSSEIVIARHIVVADRITYTSIPAYIFLGRVYPRLTPVVEVDQSLTCVWAEANRRDASNHVRTADE